MDLIVERLRKYGNRLSHSQPRMWVDYTHDSEADALLNNLEQYPHLFLLGVIADRQVKAQRAWMIPIHIARRLGSTDFKVMRKLRKQRWIPMLKGKHRFAKTIGEACFEGLRKVEDKYQSDASQIWAGRPSSAELVSRFLEFQGIGPKLATMAVNILSTRYDVPLADHYSVDISADVHVRRVFRRLGLVPTDASVDQVIFRARALSPRFPGALDRPAFEIGRTWCRSRTPLCAQCVMHDVCPCETIT